MATNQQRKSGGAKKYGRNKEKCARYTLRRLRYKNKVRRCKARYGNCAPETLEKKLAEIKVS